MNVDGRLRIICDVLFGVENEVEFYKIIIKGV